MLMDNYVALVTAQLICQIFGFAMQAMGTCPYVRTVLKPQGGLTGRPCPLVLSIALEYMHTVLACPCLAFEARMKIHPPNLNAPEGAPNSAL